MFEKVITTISGMFIGRKCSDDIMIYNPAFSVIPMELFD